MNSTQFSIGISAYNEGANIKALLESLLDQNYTKYTLNNIFVVSDGSSDNTITEIEKVDDNRITVIDSKKRLGLSKRQNQLFDMCSDDFMILLDADVLPAQDTLINYLLEPLLNDDVDLVAAKVVSVAKNKTYIGSVIEWSSNIKNNMVSQINNGDSIYVCHGRARAFSRRLYEKLRWPDVLAEDAYSYIYAKGNGYAFIYQPKAIVLFVSPQNITDYIAQSKRFFYSKFELENCNEIKAYGSELYTIPKRILVPTVMKSLLLSPINCLTYIFILTYIIVYTRVIQSNKRDPTWTPVRSTKSVQ